MCKMKILLKHGGVGGITKKDVKPTNISQFVKFYLSTHNKQPKWMRHRMYDKIILHVKEM